MVDLVFKMNLGAGYVTVPPPKNWKDMKVQLIWDSPELQLQLQSINFEWVTKNAIAIKNYFKAGLTGGTGIFEGPGLQIFGQLPGTAPVLFFDGCINTADDGFDIQDDFIMCPIKEAGKTDWFNDYAKSFRLEYLTSLAPGSPGYLSRADYKQTPYAISSIPDYTQAMLLSISLFIIIKESVDCVAKIASLVTRAISQSLSWLQLVGTIIEIVLYLIYLVAIVTASAKLMQQIADNLLQPKKTKLCMREQDTFKKIADYMGLGFVSPIYGVGTADLYGGRYVNATVMPKKIKIPDGDPIFEVFTNGRPADETSNAQAFGYFEGTAFEFKTEMESLYNAECIVKNNILYFQEKNSFNVVDAFALPNEGTPGNTFLYPQPYGTNASEIPAVYCLRFQKDDQDLNTYNDYKGTFALAQTTPNIVYNPKNQLMSGSVMVDFPFALARRKVGYTKLEKALLELLDTCAKFINSIGDRVDNINDKLSSWMPSIVSAEDVGLSNTQVGIAVGFLTGQPVFSVMSIVLGSDGLPIMPTVTIPFFGNDRIGWLLLSSDFTGVQKRFTGTQNGDDWNVHENNSAGTFVVTFNPLLNGVFTGTIIGYMGSQPFTGNVINGVLVGTAPTVVLGPGTGLVTGTIAGMTGTFTGLVSGTAAGGFFSGTGALNSVIVSTVATEGWGSAKSLLDDFHYTNLIAENQWLTFKNKTFKFSMSKFVQLSNSNILTTADGKKGKFKRIVWVLADDIAQDINYRIKEKYTNNYTIKITTDAG